MGIGLLELIVIGIFLVCPVIVAIGVLGTLFFVVNKRPKNEEDRNR